LPKKKVRVLVVNDSATMRLALRLAFHREADVEVVAEVPDGERAILAVEEHQPDVVLMDVVMPGMDGYEATRRIMQKRPTPILMISSVVNPRDVHVALEALRAGALAVAESLPSPNDAQYESKRRFLVGSVITLARSNPARRVAATPSTHRAPQPGESFAASPGTALTPAALAASAASARLANAPRVAQAVGIIASTGGPTAVMDVLRGLKPGEAPPLLVVQHIARGFGAGLARWLGDVTGHKVKVAEEGESLVRGRVYIAPDDAHLGLSSGGAIALSDDPPIGYFRPSGTHLLRSMAAALGPRAAAVVLTGMGRDGAEGAEAVRAAGGAVAVQDEASSVVYGMPRVTLERVADAEVLSLGEVASWIRARGGSP
jgi:two-component system chemotaxis response regulator CheB